MFSISQCARIHMTKQFVCEYFAIQNFQIEDLFALIEKIISGKLCEFEKKTTIKDFAEAVSFLIVDV